MSPERSQAYRRVMKTLDDMGPSKLFDSEQQRVRYAADNLIFSTAGMCYAVSVGPDPLGPYYRYAFDRQLFPDYPRPAIWPDGYYVPTSTGDEVIQKHACVADRGKMLKGSLPPSSASSLTA